MPDLFFNIILLFGLIIIIYLLSRRLNGDRNNEKITILMEKISALAEQNKDLRSLLDDKLAQTHKISQEQFGKTAGLMQSVAKETQKAMADVHRQSQRAIADITEKLTKLDETNKQVVNFSSQLQNLQDILKNPKQRGVLGEYYLEETLKNVLPPNSYQMQYGFKDGSIVDAVVFVRDKIIPIDSKFSLDSYEKLLNTSDKETRLKLEKQFKQDLKIRIDETGKYVKPAENTMDFAFMFIPSEAIYYDLLVNKVGAVQVNTRDLIEYAFKDKKVIIVSPTSFLAYLQTVLQGLRALKIEESAKLIRTHVEKLGRHLNSYENFLKRMGNSLSVTVGHYNHAYQEFGKIDKDIVKITDGKKQVELLKVDRPKID